MSQRSEKYARRMERRVAHLEERVERIKDDVTRQGVRLTTTAELLEVMAMPTYVIKANQDRDRLDTLAYSAQDMQSGVINADWEPARQDPTDRRAERWEARRRRKARRRLGALCLALLAVALLVIAVARAVATEPENMAAAVSSPQGAGAAVAIITNTSAYPEPWAGEGEDQLEVEKAEAALLAQGYLSDAVPLPYDLQDVMRTACAAYGCPYPLALAVAETESHFDQEAVGAVGEVGIMQLNPGPGGAYHAALEADTGLDPTTPEGNIVCGVYLLGKYMTAYEDPAKAVMAYNMGEAGAKKAWAAGITSTDHSAAVMEAMERWECMVNPWAGI